MGVGTRNMHALVVTYDEAHVYLDMTRELAHKHWPVNETPLPNAKEVAAIVHELVQELMDAVGDPEVLLANIGDLVHEHRVGPPLRDEKDMPLCRVCREYQESLPPRQRHLEAWARDLFAKRGQARGVVQIGYQEDRHRFRSYGGPKNGTVITNCGKVASRRNCRIDREGEATCKNCLKELADGQTH
jgi:hypothetical protein